jgi:hypothetical protein
LSSEGHFPRGVDNRQANGDGFKKIKNSIRDRRVSPPLWPMRRALRLCSLNKSLSDIVKIAKISIFSIGYGVIGKFLQYCNQTEKIIALV